MSNVVKKKMRLTPARQKRYEFLRATIGQYRTKYEWFLAAGFSESSALQQDQIVNSIAFQEIVAPHLDTYGDALNEATKALALEIERRTKTEAIKAEKLSDVATALDKVNKQRLLHQGKATSISKVEVEQDINKAIEILGIEVYDTDIS